MKRRYLCLLILVFVCALCFSGCGTQLLELTSEERQKIIDYAAHVVSEFNLRQEKGYIALSAETLEALEDKKDDQEAAPDTEDETPNEEQENSSDENKEPAGDSFTDALGIDGIHAELLTYEIVSNFSEGDVSNVTAGKGNRLLVVRCKLTNETNEEILCDIYGKDMAFYIDVNNGEKVNISLVTILEKDLTTMSAHLAAGEEREMVILFPISEELEPTIRELKLIVKNASTNYTISMN